MVKCMIMGHIGQGLYIIILLFCLCSTSFQPRKTGQTLIGLSMALVLRLALQVNAQLPMYETECHACGAVLVCQQSGEASPWALRSSA